MPPAPRQGAGRRWLGYVVCILFGTVIGIAIGAVGVGIGSDDSSEPVTAHSSPSVEADTTEEASPSPEASASIEEGLWMVGEDIQPGIYRAVIPDDSASCYWERLSGLSGSLDDIIANGLGEPGEQVFVSIAASDLAFNSDGCGTWQLF